MTFYRQYVIIICLKTPEKESFGGIIMKNVKGSALFSGLATYIFLGVIAYQTNVFPMIFSELSMLLKGAVREVAVNNTSFLMMMPVIFGVVVIALPTMIASGFFQQLILGKIGKHSIEDFFNNMGNGSHFKTFFITVVLEEVLARWVFLGLLPMIPFLSGTLMFYMLFFLGNAIWALIHLYNFEDENDRHALRVLPQFIGGIFFTYIYVKYGLAASILVHFIANAVLFSLRKTQDFEWKQLLSGAYVLICVLVSYNLMTKPIADIAVWFKSEPGFVIAGWGFWDYVLICVFITSSITTLANIFLYDKCGVDVDNGLDANIFVIMILTPLSLGLVYGLFWLTGLVTNNVPYRVLGLAILLAFGNKTYSGSSTSRLFWTSVPDVYISVCIFQAIGFWYSVCFLLIDATLLLPRYFIAKIDE